MIFFKENVKIPVMSGTLAYIFYRLEIFHSTKMSPQPDDIVITSVNDGAHMAGSKHYKNQAVDIRSKNFMSNADKHLFCARLGNWLGETYTVLFENVGLDNEHFHVQLKKGLR